MSFATEELVRIRKSCLVLNNVFRPRLADLFEIHTPRFSLRHLDPGLQQAMERSVPPLNITMISEFNASLARHSKQAGPDCGQKSG